MSAEGAAEGAPAQSSVKKKKKPCPSGLFYTNNADMKGMQYYMPHESGELLEHYTLPLLIKGWTSFQ